jgi:hypothetical protein
MRYLLVFALALSFLGGCGDPLESRSRSLDLIIIGASTGDVLAIDRRPDTGEIDGFILSSVVPLRADAAVVPCDLGDCTVLAGRLLCAGGSWHVCVELGVVVACGGTMLVCDDSYEWASY